MPKLTKDEAAELRRLALVMADATAAYALSFDTSGPSGISEMWNKRDTARAAFERRLAELTEG